MIQSGKLLPAKPRRSSPWKLGRVTYLGAMAMLTLYIVQTFTQGKGTRLIADQPQRVGTAEEAVRRAERAAGYKAGAVAFRQSVDADTDEVDEAVTILFRAGSLPQQFSDD